MTDIENDANYESNDGFSTSIWGSSFWHILHMITFNYPVKPTTEDKKRYRAFFTQLGYVLPCGVCRKNYQEKTRKLSLVIFRSRHTLSRWLYNLHIEIPHTHVLPNYFELRNNYEIFRSKCTSKGCILPNNFIKSKCVLNIVPADSHQANSSFNLHKKCRQKKKNLE